MGFEISVAVSADTDVQSEGDELKLSDVAVGDFVRVSGTFINSGIIANEIIIIDRGDGEFRLRGHITNAQSTSDGRVVTLLGIDILVDSKTILERRGPAGGITAADLVPNLLIDVRGFHDDGKFIATRVKVGNREDDPIRVHFKGNIVTVTTNRLTIDTGSGGATAVVLIGTATVITGRIAPGQFVDVTGTLNANLEVVATRIRAKSDERDDDDFRPVTIFEKRVAILPVGTGGSIKGEAEAQLESSQGRVEQEFEIEFRGAQPRTFYSIRVDVSGVGSVLLGTVQTNSEGNAEKNFGNLAGLLPASKTVRDITKVQILTSGGIVVAEGSFQ